MDKATQLCVLRKVKLLDSLNRLNEDCELLVRCCFRGEVCLANLISQSLLEFILLELKLRKFLVYD
jgi:hypothetical protein